MFFFRGVRGSSSAKKNFMYYCIYAWGMATFLSILVLSLDMSNISEEYKPGMYFTQQCFLKRKCFSSYINQHYIIYTSPFRQQNCRVPLFVHDLIDSCRYKYNIFRCYCISYQKSAVRNRCRSGRRQQSSSFET